MTYDELVEGITARHPEVKPGQMFGMPCLKRDGKVVAGYWKDGGVAIKLTDGAARTDALGVEGASLFDPGMGRPMREWVHIPAGQADSWEALVERALAT